MKLKVTIKKFFPFVILFIIICHCNNFSLLAQDTTIVESRDTTTELSWIEGIVDSFDTVITGIVGLLLLLGSVVYLIVTKFKVLSEITPKLLQSKKNLDEQVFYDNHETIIEYLKSNKWDQYNTAFAYILHHNAFPYKIIKELTKIILNEKPFNKRVWITDKERIKASQHLCFILKKNNQKMNGSDAIAFCNIDKVLEQNSNSVKT